MSKSSLTFAEFVLQLSGLRRLAASEGSVRKVLEGASEGIAEEFVAAEVLQEVELAESILRALDSGEAHDPCFLEQPSNVSMIADRIGVPVSRVSSIVGQYNHLRGFVG